MYLQRFPENKTLKYYLFTSFKAEIKNQSQPLNDLAKNLLRSCIEHMQKSVSLQLQNNYKNCLKGKL